MTYRIKEIFRTLQGEGYNAGRTAIFVRFVGCNLWSGHVEHRERDATRGQVGCPRYCDTDFVDGEAMTAAEVLSRVLELTQGDGLLVITGGEPLLQLDLDLARALGVAMRAKNPEAILALETNGTRELAPEIRAELGHITVSPKVPEYDLKVREGAELRVPWPGLAPEQYEGMRFTHKYISPIGESGSGLIPGLAKRSRMVEASRFCLEHPTWRLSVQLHKLIGVP